MKSKTFNLKKFSFIRPGYIITISLILAALLILSAVIEYNENKNEIRHLLDEHANSTIDLITKSSANILSAEREMENLLSQQLLGTARNVKRLDSTGVISNSLLEKIAEENNVYRINVFNKNGEKIYSSNISESAHMQGEGKYSPKEFIGQVLSGEKQELVIGFKEARFEKGSRYAVAVSRSSARGGAIVVNLDADAYLQFRKNTGFEKMINDIGSKSGIVYIVLQDENKIFASNKKIDEFKGYGNDEFIKEAFEKNLTRTREITYQGNKVFELVHPFSVDGEKYGIYRIGLSMDEIVSAESRMYRRTLIISLVLVIISVFVVGIIVSNQNYKLISKEYKKIQTFTGNILDYMPQAIITTDLEGTVKIFNKAAEKLFGKTSSDVSGKNVNESLPQAAEYFKGNVEFSNYETIFQNAAGEKIYLNINKTLNFSAGGTPEFITLVIRDVTELKKLDMKSRLNEKMIAMGELASAVAHEVRNPLNSITMISQRLGKEYKELYESGEFTNLNSVLQSESKRINNIIEEFLKYARPPKLNPVKINSDDFLNRIKTIAEANISGKNIEFIMNCKDSVDFNIDSSQMNQALMNIINNAIDAVEAGGKIELIFFIKNKKTIFEISDSGKGIPEENLGKIFNLYFTTKAKGTGLGLSIVQQVISQHNGTVYAESTEGKGTTFFIELPI